MRNVWWRLYAPVRRAFSFGRRLKGSVTFMAFTDSGWMRRFRVPRLAVSVIAFLLVALTMATVLSVAFAVWAGADLRRLTAVERENRSLTTQLQEQAGQLTRLQVEMSRLRELERNLRAVSGLADLAEAGERSGKGGGLPPALPR